MQYAEDIVLRVTVIYNLRDGSTVIINVMVAKYRACTNQNDNEVGILFNILGHSKVGTILLNAHSTRMDRSENVI